LTALGGSLGSGANWRWFTGTCGGTYSGSGLSITISPSITTTYFVRGESTCNTTICVSKTITISPAPVAPIIAATNMYNYCSNIVGNISLSDQAAQVQS